MGTPTYDRENTRRINLKLNNKTDADIIQQLEAQKGIEGIQGYLKRLIRNDIQRGAKTMKYQINYIDPKTGANSEIDTVEAQEGYTAADYIADCDENADAEWCEMLHAGTVTISAIED